MADVVQMNMERMIPELENLQEREIFSKGEIKKIVKQRRDFEYRIQRKSPNKLDFLRYIEFEMNIDLLLRKRKQRLNIVKSSKHDYGPIKRVSLIYSNALRRFPNDLALWYQYLDHLEAQRSAKALRGTYPKALQLYPREAKIWVRAAAFEFSIQKDIAAARVMMQRGLRINVDSELLWVSFFTMEIRYVQKLLARRRAMGLAHSAVGGVEGALSQKEAEFLKGALPRAIHRNCMSKPKLSASLSLHLQFLQTIPKPTPIFNTKSYALKEKQRHITGYQDPFKDLREEVLKGLREKLGGVEEDAWVAVASEALRAGERERLIHNPKMKTQHSPCERKALAVYERAIESLPTARMYLKYAQFLRERAAHDLPNDKEKKDISRRLLNLFRRAVATQKSGVMHAKCPFTISSDLYLIWADSLIRLGLPLEAAEILNKSTEEYPSNPIPWMRLAELSMRGIFPKDNSKLNERNVAKTKKSFFEDMMKENYTRTVSILEKGLRSVPAKDSKPLWLRLLFLHTGEHMHDPSKVAASHLAIEKTFKSALASLGTSAAPDLAISYLDWCVVSNGASLTQISAAVRTMLGYGSSASLGVHMRCLEALACAQPPASTKDITLASEKSIDRFGKQSVDLWLWLARWEMRTCDSGGAAAAAKIAWRAEKVLEEPSVKSEFRRRYRDMVGDV